MVSLIKVYVFRGANMIELSQVRSWK